MLHDAWRESPSDLRIIVCIGLCDRVNVPPRLRLVQTQQLRYTVLGKYKSLGAAA